MPCVLCDGLNDNFKNIQNHYSDLNVPIVLFETDTFKVIPDKFPISPYHIIILPKKHINTFAEFGDKETEEVKFVLDYLQSKTKADNFLMFEHGTSKKEENNTDPTIKSIFHAHLHFIPDVPCSTRDIDRFFKGKSSCFVDKDGKIKNIWDYETVYRGNADLIPFLRRNVVYENDKKDSIESYLYIKNSDGTHLFFPERLIRPRLPSQFLREALSKACHTPEWNWKIPMSEEGKKKYAQRIFQMTRLFSSSNKMVHICKHRLAEQVKKNVNSREM